MPRTRKSAGLGVTAALVLGAIALLAYAQDTHRSLRSNAGDEMPAPTEPATFAGYAGAPKFSVVPRTDSLKFYPCTACHSALPPNPQPRLLAAPHPAALPHGAGRFWCLDCHQTRDRDQLRLLSGAPVDFNDSDKVCGQCHFRQHKDWHFGAHGKRVANWQGERQIYSCTHCHDPHDPVTKPRQASPPPPVRAGLAPMPRHGKAFDEKPRWERAK
jgi:hypothetical protein